MLLLQLVLHSHSIRKFCKMSRKFCTYNPTTKILKGKTRQQIYNVDANLGYILLQKLLQNPQKFCQFSDDLGSKTTNLEMYERSLKFANYFSSILKLKQGDIVGLIASNVENLTPIIFGCLSLGVAINPLALQMGVEEITQMWSKLKPKVIFSDSKLIETVQKAVNEMKLDAKIYTMMGRIEGYEYADDILDVDYDVECFDFPDLPNISSSIAFINCSSGTTGSPKGICKSHKQVIAQSFLMWDQNKDGTDVYFNTSQSYWGVHQFMLISCTLYDIPLVVKAQPYEPNMFMDILDRYKVTVAMTSPTFCARLLKSPGLRKLESVRFNLLSGDPFNEKLVKELSPVFPNGKVLSCYGTTEADSISVSLGSEGIFGLSSGFLYYNVQLKVINEDGTVLGPNQPGEICYKSAVTFSGYFDNPKATAEVYDADGFEKSGDLGYFDESGRIYVLNRLKNMIKSIGRIVITPMEVENHVNKIDGVAQSCAVGVFDEEIYHDRIYVFVVKEKDRMDLTEDKIVNYMKENVIEAKRISGGVYFVNEIPLNSNGKVLYRKMKNLAENIKAGKVQVSKNNHLYREA